MWPFSRAAKYEAVATDEEQKANDDDAIKRPSSSKRWTLLVWSFVLLVTIVAIATVSVTSIHNRAGKQEENIVAEDEINPLNQNSRNTTSALEVDVVCPLRREWRSLSTTEQKDYITSVRCLLDKPSILGPNCTRYDDWPYIHSHVGYYTHHSAPFLPWHRYFLHIYETTLRQECGYTGSLVYWDWTLDADDLAHSTIFSPDTGFGGDGDVTGAKTVGNSGHCVVDGPFSDIKAKFYDTKAFPHCLSRGFHDDQGVLGHIDGHDITPESIDQVLQVDTYESFVAQLESKVHDAIPFGIGGDFETFTAPYDPLFFLHHTQLDRLWWLWQQRDDGKRVNSYGGHNHRHSVEQAKLEDEITMQGLAPPIKVQQVMDTENGFLCYRYQSGHAVSSSS